MGGETKTVSFSLTVGEAATAIECSNDNLLPGFPATMQMQKSTQSIKSMKSIKPGQNLHNLMK